MTTPTLSLAQVASLTGARLVGDPLHEIHHVASIEEATHDEITFVANPRYASALAATRAGAIFIDPSLSPANGKNCLVVDDPSAAFQMIAEIFYPPELVKSGFSGIHPTAVIHKTARIGENVTIGPFVVIDREVTIDADTTIGAHCFIGTACHLGKEVLLHPHVTLREDCQIGDRVVIQPGAVIGSCGFGFITDAKGQHTKLRQMGKVVIEEDVEIGANTCIDRARFKETRICKGTKIDNLVQIAHGVKLGQHNLIVAQSGIAGSSKTGKHVILGGQAALVGHIEVCDNVMLAARGAPAKSILKPGKYAGAPAMPLMDHNRQSVQLRQIDKLIQRIEALEKRASS